MWGGRGEVEDTLEIPEPGGAAGRAEPLLLLLLLFIPPGSKVWGSAAAEARLGTGEGDGDGGAGVGPREGGPPPRGAAEPGRPVGVPPLAPGRALLASAG